jgi:hypothetical protein
MRAPNRQQIAWKFSAVGKDKLEPHVMRYHGKERIQQAALLNL